MKPDKIEITHEEPEIVASTTYWSFEMNVNGKNIEVSRWSSFDENCGVTDEGFEIDSGKEDLTEEEIEAVEEYIYDKVEFVR